MKNLIGILMAMMMTNLAQATVVVNTSTISTATFCEGSTLILSFNVTGGNFPTSQYSYDVRIATSGNISYGTPIPFFNGTSVVTSWNPGAPGDLQSPKTVTVTIPSGYSGNYKIGVTVGYGFTTNVAPAAGQLISIYPSSISTPTISVNGTNPICSGGSVTLSTSSLAYSYSWNGGATTTVASYITPATSVLTTYSLTVSNPPGCASSNATAVTIGVISAPTASVTSSQTICSGKTATLVASGGTSYLWSNGYNTSSISVSPTSTIAYSATVTNTCGSSIVTTTVIVNPVPTVSIVASATTICSSDNVAMSVAPSGAYLWSTGETTSSIVVSPTSTSSYSATVTNSYGCSTTNNLTISVNPTPLANAGPDVTINNDSIVGTSNVPGQTYSWSPSAGLSDVTVAMPTVYIQDISQIGGSITYTLIVSTILCGQDTDYVTVSVSPSVTSVGDTYDSKNTINVFPNPASSSVFVDIPKELSGKQIEISVYNFHGARVSSFVKEHDGELGFDVSYLSMGNYMVTISASGFYATSKLTVVK